MPRALSMDLRVRVISAIKAGESTAAIADRFEIGTATVKRYARQHREQGHVFPSDVRGHPPRAMTAEDVEALLEIVKERPDATLAELTDAYNELGRSQVSASTVGRRIREAGLTRKKRQSRPRRRTPLG